MWQCGGVGGVWVWACFTASQENQDILSGQTQHSRELIEHDWVRMSGRQLSKQQKYSINGGCAHEKYLHHSLCHLNSVCSWFGTNSQNKQILLLVDIKDCY